MERKAMHLRSWMLTLAIGLAASAASATPPPRTPAKIAWRPLLKAAPGKTPWCFAYSPAHRAYACLGSAPSDSDQSARAGYVDLLGGHATKTVVESHAVAGAVKPIAPTTAIDARLAELGFTSVPLEATTLTPDEWHPVDDAAVRLSVRLHEGDASFEYFGDVTVRCPNAREIEVNVRKRGLELGEVARLYHAPGTRTLALSVVGEDGGEDMIETWVNTVVIDTAALCAGASGIAGPIEGRSVGPW
jgi:hypothetical protein